MSNQGETDWKRRWWTKEEAEATGLPIFGFYKWSDGKEPSAQILLTESRCAELGVPVRTEELPVAFRFSVNGEAKRKFCRLFDRTGQVNESDLLEKEIVKQDNS